MCIIGPSGCGKTTLLKLIGGLLTPRSPSTMFSGSLTIDGKSPDTARRAREFGFVFQNPVLLPWRKVTDNIKLPLEIIGDAKPRGGRTLEDLLELVGLADFAQSYPYQLSGGMQQRVSIARALAFNPSVLLMDEPFGSLDERTRENLHVELRKIFQLTGATVIFTTHSLSEAVFLSDRIFVLSTRPAVVTSVVNVDLSQERSVKIKEETHFVKLVSHVRGRLE